MKTRIVFDCWSNSKRMESQSRSYCLNWRHIKEGIRGDTEKKGFLKKNRETDVNKELSSAFSSSRLIHLHKFPANELKLSVADDAPMRRESSHLWDLMWWFEWVDIRQATYDTFSLISTISLWQREVQKAINYGNLWKKNWRKRRTTEQDDIQESHNRGNSKSLLATRIELEEINQIK